MRNILPVPVLDHREREYARMRPYSCYMCAHTCISPWEYVFAYVHVCEHRSGDYILATAHIGAGWERRKKYWACI